MEKYQVPTVHCDFFLHSSGNKRNTANVVFLNHDLPTNTSTSHAIVQVMFKPEAFLWTGSANKLEFSTSVMFRHLP